MYIQVWFWIEVTTQPKAYDNEIGVGIKIVLVGKPTNAMAHKGELLGIYT